ncbi:MAG TPA: DUF6782 family putative metallopeptidase [Myxococcales bacterium]|jgi:hypothetical protein|nr:DUF6782 family putative metallopeptidase [Myxococcales bacterium]
MVLALLLAAGASAPAAPADAQASPPAAAASQPSEAETTAIIREVTADVEKLRGLHRKQNLKVELLDGPLFLAKVREKALVDLTPKAVAEEKARWLAFDLAPAEADPAKILLAVLDEQVAGFYDPHEKKLFVRHDGTFPPELLRIVLAHEIEHALQDQNFGIPDLAALPDDDQRLAHSALLEGDAMAVMTAYAAQRAGKPVKEAIAQSAAAMLQVGTDGLTGNAAQLKQAPPVVREELLFPYARGFALVAEAYGRGGWAQVDKLFARPPVSSHQVLHPEAYFAGEEPLAVPPPALPQGAKLLARGRMGELGARLALETCLDPEVGRDFVQSWAGDAYVVYELHGHAELIWESAWSAGVAENVANLLRLLAPCWSEQKGVSGEVNIVKKGSLVGLSRGSADLAAILSVPLKKPSPAPASQ